VDAAGIRNLNNGDLTINGVAIRAAAAADDNVSSTVAASSSKSASAISIAAAINAASAQTGVSAVANDVTLTANTTATTLTGTGASVTINGVAITIEGLATTDTAQARREKVAAAINNFGGMTGVTASDNGLGGLDLTAADGRNLSVAIVAGGATAAELGLGGTSVKGSGSAYTIAVTAATAETAYGTVRLESAKAIDVRAGSQAFAAASNFTALGFEENSYGASAGGLRISDIDVSTADGATAALDAIDTALNSVNLDRANIGAVQNRLEAAVNNLSSNSTNLQASRSRIQDTDFATESTNLAKNQVLSQAAQAMLARANQSAQQVTQLLQ